MDKCMGRKFNGLKAQKMKDEDKYRQVFKKQHDCLIGTGDNIQIAMTEERFIDVLRQLNLLPIHNVSGLFVLYRMNRQQKQYWNGKEWTRNKFDCPRYEWHKANEYAKVLGCNFTDCE